MLESVAQCEWEKRTQDSYTSRTEVWGRLQFLFPEGAISLSARADRIDYLTDGTAHIIDYKTGALPSFIDIDRMKSIQLPLEAVMLEQGGFDSRPTRVSKISWWHIGISQGCRIKSYPRALDPVLKTYHTQLPLWLHQFLRTDYTIVN
jgi:ATP-dependent helicase/nuclease subunit B